MKQLVIILSLLGLGLFAQPPKKFYSTYGGAGVDIGYSCKEIYQRQYVVLGSTSSYGKGASDAYLLLLDSLGQLLWQKTFGGVGIDVGKSVVFNSKDSGFVFTGYTSSFGNGGYDIYVVRTDKHGEVIWEKSFGGIDWDFGADLCFASDGHVVLCANSFNHGFGKKDGQVIKVNITNGAMMWQKYFGGGEDDELNGIVTVNGNDFYLLGSTASYGDINGDAWCYKINGNGDSLMSIIYGGNQYDKANSAIINQLGEIFVCGGSNSFTNGKMDAFFMKFSATGSLIWKKYFGLSGEDEESFKMVFATSPVIGESVAIYTTKEYPLLKKDIKTIYLTFGGDFYGGGFSGSFGFEKNEEVFDLITTSDKGYLQVGYTESLNAQESDVFLVKRDSLLDRGSLSLNLLEPLNSPAGVFRFYPNPLKGDQYLHIEGFDRLSDARFTLYDINGRELYNATPEPGNKVKLDQHKLLLQPGIYIARLITGESSYYGRLIKD